jgi:hypothetical protein
VWSVKSFSIYLAPKLKTVLASQKLKILVFYSASCDTKSRYGLHIRIGLSSLNANKIKK